MIPSAVSLQPRLMYFFTVAVILLNVNAELFFVGLSILTAYVKCIHFIVTYKMTPNIRSPQCSAEEYELSCVKVKSVHLDYVVL